MTQGEPESRIETSNAKWLRRMLYLLAAAALLFVAGAAVLLYTLAVSRRVPLDQQGRESSAISSLKDIETCQLLFQAQPTSKSRYGTLEQLVEEKLMPARFGKGAKGGYTFETGPGALRPESQYWARATPTAEWLEATRGDTRTFFTNETGKIWFTTGGTQAPITPDCKPPPNWPMTER